MKVTLGDWLGKFLFWPIVLLPRIPSAEYMIFICFCMFMWLLVLAGALSLVFKVILLLIFGSEQ